MSCFTGCLVMLILVVTTAPSIYARKRKQEQCLRGPPGLNGRDGAPGRDGLKGLNGRDGLPGKACLTGVAGKAGLTGLPGKAGFNITGPRGKTGLTGPAGKTGLTGPAGPRGSSGSIANATRAAFTVRYVGADQPSKAAGQLVTFNQVITNIGNGFNTGTSQFTCKIPGVYYFCVSLLGGHTTHAHIFLMKNDQQILDAWGWPPYGAAVGQAYLSLKVGDRVWVAQGTGGSDRAVHGLRSSFSGALLYPD